MKNKQIQHFMEKDTILKLSTAELKNLLVKNGLITVSDSHLNTEITVLGNNQGISMRFAGNLEQATYTEKQAEILAAPIRDHCLSVRAYNCLIANKIDSLGEIISLTSEEMFKKYRHFGQKTLDEISQLLQQHGLDFRLE